MALMLIGALLVPGLAIAANTRSLSIGSPPIPANAGKLLPTPVSVPAAGAPLNSTIFLVQVLSTDNQNIANTVLTVNAGTAAGLALNDIYDPQGGSDDSFCGTSGNVITCDYGSLAAGTERTIAVVVDVTPAFVVAGQSTLFSAQVTTNNENGTNQQLFTANSGNFTVGAFSANGLSTFVPPGQAKQLFTSALGTAGAGNLSTTVSFTSTGGEVVAINEGTSTQALYRCPTGLSCQPDFSEVVTTSGSFDTSPYFLWRLTALVPKAYTLSQGFVAHYPTGAQNPDWTLLFKSKSSFCGSLEITSNGHCIRTLTLSKPVGNFSTLVVEVVMDHQGGLKY
jgi:hypothetical protein